MRFRDLAALGESGLRSVWRWGGPPDAQALAGWIFRGLNTSIAARRSPLTGPAFAKGFYRADARLHGCNFPVTVQSGEWKVDVARPFGFFAVRPAPSGRRGWDGRGTPEGALLLDYGRGRIPDRLAARRPRLSPTLRLLDRLARPLRDPLVRPAGGGKDVYVGRAYLGRRLGLPVTCFVIERWAPLPEEWGALVGGPRRGTP